MNILTSSGYRFIIADKSNNVVRRGEGACDYEFENKLHVFHESLKFILPFLNTMIHLNKDTGELWTEVYSKLTESQSYLYYNSSAPYDKKVYFTANFLELR